MYHQENHEPDFMESQIKAIEEAKWLEGERIHDDPGSKFVRDWINKNAKSFRKEWEDEHK